MESSPKLSIEECYRWSPYSSGASMKSVWHTDRVHYPKPTRTSEDSSKMTHFLAENRFFMARRGPRDCHFKAHLQLNRLRPPVRCGWKCVSKTRGEHCCWGLPSSDPMKKGASLVDREGVLLQHDNPSRESPKKKSKSWRSMEHSLRHCPPKRRPRTLRSIFYLPDRGVL